MSPPTSASVQSSVTSTTSAASGYWRTICITCHHVLRSALLPVIHDTTRSVVLSTSVTSSAAVNAERYACSSRSGRLRQSHVLTEAKTNRDGDSSIGGAVAITWSTTCGTTCTGTPTPPSRSVSAFHRVGTQISSAGASSMTHRRGTVVVSHTVWPMKRVPPSSRRSCAHDCGMQWASDT